MHDTTVADHRNLADDILWGVDGPNGIAAFLGISARRCYYLIESGAIPVNSTRSSNSARAFLLPPTRARGVS